MQLYNQAKNGDHLEKPQEFAVLSFRGRCSEYNVVLDIEMWCDGGQVMESPS